MLAKLSRHIVLLGLVAVLGGVLGACSVPRGAALRSEILSEGDGGDPGYAVVAVTRANTDLIAGWPAPGDGTRHRWLPGGRGSGAPLIAVGDALDIVIWDSQENSLLISEGETRSDMPTVTVSEAGTVFLPYIGKVAVAGLTPDAARDRVQGELTRISDSVQVQLDATAGRTRMIDLVGGVARPGRYPLEDRDTGVLSVLAMGGGIAPGLRHPLVRLLRGGATYEIRAETLLADAQANTLLRAGDRLSVVEDSRSYNALGASGAERVIHFTTENLSAMQALSEIGGLADSRANPAGVLVLRDYGAHQLGDGTSGPEMAQVVFTIDLTSADGLFAARRFLIQPGDTVLVTESPLTQLRTVLGVFGAGLGVGRAVDG